MPKIKDAVQSKAGIAIIGFIAAALFGLCVQSEVCQTVWQEACKATAPVEVTVDDVTTTQ